MKTDETTQTTRRWQRFNRAAWFVLIVLSATTAGMFASWRAPGLNTYAQDFLMRTRGDLPEPDDIVIVAIDEASINRLGRFPWRRTLSARALDKISEGAPKAIALDVLYSEPTDAAEDKALRDAIKKAGNVVASEQLIENRDTPELSRSEWLRSLPEIETAAGGAGHVNVETERDGEACEMLLKLADDDGESRWALAVETVRIGDNLNADEISETNRFVRVGTRKIPFTPIERNLFVKNKDASGGVTTIQPLRMTIDYIGGSGSFAAQTLSFADVLDGKIAPERFRGKYVLIGATAATLGDRIATPFVHTENAEGDQHGDLMPGVEILANSINTILRGRFYQPVSDSAAALLAALTALAVIILLGLAQGKYEALKQIGVLAAMLGLIFFGSYLTFVHGFINPPIIPMLVSFIVAAPLALLRRSLVASAFLDESINELVSAEKHLFTNGQRRLSPDSNPPHLETGEEIEFENNFAADKFYLPRGLEWKSNALGFLSRDLIKRAVFVDSALRSIEDGLLITDREGQIVFANKSAVRIFNLSERKLLGTNIFEQLFDAENSLAGLREEAEDALAELTIDQNSIEREITVGKTDARHYILRMAAVVGRDETDAGDALGIVATLSDITQHRELQKTKNDVITLVTHELRTPLTAIQGMSELLTEHAVEPEPQRKMLLTINTEAKRLAQMINEYLDITRLEAGAQKINFAPVAVEALIDRNLLMLEPLAAKRGIKIVHSYLLNHTTVSGDAERLAQMLTNIVGNAVKYSPPHTSITIETRTANGVLEIIVADEGYGISHEHLPRIFDKFYRISRRETAEIPGTGLGLSLAQEIAELHGGRISAESEPGKGSTFTIRLPIATGI